MLENLKRRDRLLRSLRASFQNNGYLEVETPVRIPAPAQEAQIDCPASEGAWLRASPELQMKRLLAAGAERIFQMGPCFRKDERGRHHNPEFTLLEWYQTQATAYDMLDECVTLIAQAARDVTGGTRFIYQGRTLEVGGAVLRFSVRDAFLRWAGWDPTVDWDADRFDADLVSAVEPNLPTDCPCILADYPAPAASLARLSPHNPRVAERAELYLGGLELANAYSELTDGTAQRQRFQQAADERRAAGRPVYPLDEAFLADLTSGRFPPCGGIALGVDRLAMLLCDAASIDEVRLFCPPIGNLDNHT